MKLTGGFLKNRKLIFKHHNLRPTTEKIRQSVFDICSFLIQEGEFLDVFAGSGIMGMEALSRGARLATFLEKDLRALRLIKENLSRLQLSERAVLIPGDAFDALKMLGKKHLQFNLIYVDPPYHENRKDQIVQQAVLEHLDQLDLLAAGGILFIEMPSQVKLCTSCLMTLQLEKLRKTGTTCLYQLCKKG